MLVSAHNRIRFVGTCSSCRRRRKIVTDIDLRSASVKGAFCHGCKTVLLPFWLKPPRRIEVWRPKTTNV
jgi:hypothetical protein